jgi:RNA polymerase sigma-B factor
MRRKLIRHGWPVPAPGDPPPDAEGLAEEYARTRDPVLRERTVLAHAHLVERGVLDFNGRGVPPEDLRQVGYLGLLTALEFFDPDRGVRFSTYANYLVRGEMRHFLRDHGETIRQPRWLRSLNRRIEEEVGRFVAAEGRFPRIEDLAVALNILEDGLRHLLQVREAARAVPLDAADEDEQPEVSRRRIRHRAYVSFQLPIEDKIVLYQAMERLTLLQRRVLYYLFFRGLTQPETAREIGISQKHVSRLLARSLVRLRGLLSGG